MTACFLCFKRNKNLSLRLELSHMSGLIIPFLCRKAQLHHTNVCFLYLILSFYEMMPFIRARRKTDLMVSFSKSPGKWFHFIKQRQLIQTNEINTG